MKPSHSEFGDQPYLNEILDNKYIFLKKSDKFPIAGMYEYQWTWRNLKET